MTKINAVRYDLGKTLTLLKSAAVARAIAENTSSSYQPEMGNVVVNLMYNIMPWKERLGVNVVNQAPRRVIGSAAEKHYADYTKTWLEGAIYGGGSKAQKFLETIQKNRDRDMENVQTLFRETAKTNDEAFTMCRNHILAMQAVVCTGTIAVAALGAYGAIAIMSGAATIIPIGGGAAALSATGVGSGVAMGLVKEWGEGVKAQVVGVGKDLLPKAAEKGGDWVCEKIYETATENRDAAQEVYDGAVKTIAHFSKYSANVIRQRCGKSIAGQVAKTIRDAKVAQFGAEESMQRAAGLAATGRFVNRACPIVCAVWESVDAVLDFKKVYDETGPTGGR